jgi:hypothetical protein
MTCIGLLGFLCILIPAVKRSTLNQQDAGGNLLEHDMSKPDDNQLPSLADIFGYETAEENEEAAADYIRKIQERDD